MNNIIIIIIMLMFCQCKTQPTITYKLVEKHPYGAVPSLTLYKKKNECFILDNQTGSTFLNFKFDKDREDSHFLIIHSIEINNKVSMNKGDTILIYEKRLLIWNKDYKLTFEEE